MDKLGSGFKRISHSDITFGNYNCKCSDSTNGNANVVWPTVSDHVRNVQKARRNYIQHNIRFYQIFSSTKSNACGCVFPSTRHAQMRYSRGKNYRTLSSTKKIVFHCCNLQNQCFCYCYHDQNLACNIMMRALLATKDMSPFPWFNLPPCILLIK